MRRWLLPLLTLAIAAVLVVLDRAGRDDHATGIDGGPESPIGSGSGPESDIQPLQPQGNSTDPTRVAVDAGGESVTAPGGLTTEDLRVLILVHEENGAPVTKVVFHMWRMEQGRPAERGRQDLDLGSSAGEYELYGMTTGEWTVVVDGEPSGWPPGVARERLTVHMPYEGPPLEVVLKRPGTLSGRVEDADGFPLTGVQVRAWLPDQRTRIGKTTNEEGQFDIGPVREGQWKVIATLRGTNTEQMVEVLPGSQSYLVLRFERAGTIEGLVLDASGQPLAGARVTLIKGSPNVGRVDADAEGRFRFSPVTPGNYTLVAVNPREGSGSDPAAPEQRSSARVQVVAGETVQVTLGEGANSIPVRVQGTLTSGGEPVPGVGLFAVREGEVLLAGTRSTRTDAEGRYSIQLDGPGVVLFRADTTWAQATLSIVDVPPGPLFRHDIAIPAGSVSGELVDTQGHAWRWNVTLEPEGASRSMPWAGSKGGVKVENDGGFRFPAVPPGTYVLRAHGGAGWSVHPLHGIVVSEGQAVSGLELTARPGGALSGRVTDGNGEGVAGAEVFVRDLTGTPLISTPEHSGADGRYSFAALPAGRVLVSAQTEAAAAQVQVTLAAEGSRQLDLELEAGTVLTLSTRDAEGFPLPAGLTVFGPDGDQVTALIGPSRRARTLVEVLSFSSLTLGPLPPGIYRVVAHSADGRRAEREVKLGGEPTLELPLELR